MAHTIVRIIELLLANALAAAVTAIFAIAIYAACTACARWGGPGGFGQPLAPAARRALATRGSGGRRPRPVPDNWNPGTARHPGHGRSADASAQELRW